MNVTPSRQLAENLFSVKMRASQKGAHISGAERIVPASALPQLAAVMTTRALDHAKGKPDFINIKIEAAPEPLRLKALAVSTHPAKTPEEGWAIARALLAADGFTRIDEILARFRETYGMRGAMLLDADTLERLEPDPARGVRATFMDAAASASRRFSAIKNHYAEAVVLATKVAHAPGIVGEICLSDDPDYVTGYVASKRIGYARITCLASSSIAVRTRRWARRLTFSSGDACWWTMCRPIRRGRVSACGNLPRTISRGS